MEKKQFAKDLTAKDNVADVFVIKHIALMTGKDGRNYLNVVLSDSTGDIEARKWHGGEKVAEQLGRGDFAFVRGKMNSYQNRVQLVIDEIGPVDATQVNQEHFVVKSSSAPEKMFNELMDIVDTIDDVYLKDLVNGILMAPDVNRRFKAWPAGKTVHHAYQSGLLEHTLGCTRLATLIAPLYNLNRNYVIAGTVLHDLCKIYELSDGLNTDYTDEGKLVGHLIKGLELIDFFSAKIPNFPHATKMHLKHIIASHHGEYEYGSPKLPQTSEALLVYYIDLIDSKMNSFELAKKSDNLSGNWTAYVKHLDRVIYKSELPHHSEYIKHEEVKETKEVKAHKDDRPVNSMMANLLKDVKIETKN